MKAVATCMAIIAIAVLDSIALFKGVDGYILIASMAIISGLAGYIAFKILKS